MIRSLTIIFPIFNEEARLGKSLDELKKFVEGNPELNLEIIFVNDGSKDNSQLIIQKFIKENRGDIYKYFGETTNNGKGYALKIGVENATKDWILTSDIDLSVPLDQINVWVKKGKIESNKSKVFFGSREVDDSIVEKKIYRYLLGSILNSFIKILFKFNIKDTQCGFKLYKSDLAKKVFKKLKILRFAHDIELIVMIYKMNEKITELPVKWVHVPQSKLNIFTDPIKMFIDILKIYKNSKSND